MSYNPSDLILGTGRRVPAVTHAIQTGTRQSGRKPVISVDAKDSQEPFAATGDAWVPWGAAKPKSPQRILTNPAKKCFATLGGASPRTKAPVCKSGARGAHPRRRPMQRSQATELQNTLARVAIFSRLPTHSLKTVRETCSWEHYRPGDPIVDYLDASDDVFFITVARYASQFIQRPERQLVFVIWVPATYLASMPLSMANPRCASVVAKTDCLIASMSAIEFRKLLVTEPMVSQALIGELVRNVRTLTKRVYEFSTLAVNNRIQAELLRLASLAPREGKSARLIPPPTHADIASRVSTHREAVTRELNRLSRIGIIERQPGILIVRDVDRLAEMLHEMTGE